MQPAWFALEPFLLDLLAERRPAARRRRVELAAALGPAAGWEAFKSGRGWAGSS